MMTRLLVIALLLGAAVGSVHPGHYGVDLLPTYTFTITPNDTYVPLDVSKYSQSTSPGFAIFNTTKDDSIESFSSWLQKGYQMLPHNASHNSSRRLNVFGVDDRTLVSPAQMDQYPYRCIGKFVLGGSFCTGTIISSDVVLTNRHCLGLLSSGELPDGFYEVARFLAGFSNGESNYEIGFAKALWSSEAEDFALLQLREAIGQFTGWPGIKWTATSYFDTPRQLALLGYSGDLLTRFDTPSIVTDCSSTGVVSGLVLHNCDNTRGSSGSPVFDSFDGDSPLILAYNDGEFRRGEDSEFLEYYTNTYANTMKPTLNFQTSLTLFTDIEISALDTNPNNGSSNVGLGLGITAVVILGLGLFFFWRTKEEEPSRRNDKLQMRL